MNSVEGLEKLEKLWFSLIRNFNKRPIDFNFKQAVLTYLGEKRSDVYTHYIHPYPAKMFPYIPTFFFSMPNLFPYDGIVLDPFCGSGTVLLESLVNPYYKRNAYGVEINPLGRLIAKVKTTPLKEEELGKRINQLFKTTKKSDKKVSRPESDKIDFWFSKKAIKELGKLRYLIEEEGGDDDYKDFFWVCFSSIIRKVSKADPFIPPPVLLRIQKYKNSREKYKTLLQFLKQAKNPNVIGLFKSAVEKNFMRMRSLNNVKEVRKGEVKVQIIWDDARHIRWGRLRQKGMLVKNGAKNLRPNSIDFILTSPPYLTAQKYIRTNCLELLWLGFAESEILRLEKEIIGSERISLREMDYSGGIGVRSIDALIGWTALKSLERAAVLFKYFSGMKQAMVELHRVLKDESYAILVVGNNKVLGKNVDTYRFLIDLAIHSGFKLILILKDEIRERGMITKRHDSGGLIKEEFIVVLKKEG
jgi:DNA modification methylase